MYVDQNNKRALADLFLPQFNWIVEIDEAHHLSQEEEDKRRIDGIRSIVDPNIRVSRIRINDEKKTIRPDADIIYDIDCLVADIRRAKQKAINAGAFTPWAGEEKELLAEYHKNKKFIVADSGDDSLSTVSEVLSLFFLRKSARRCAQYYPEAGSGIMIWCPKLMKNRDWENTMYESGADVFIKEKHLSNGVVANDNNVHIDDYRTKSHTRVVFIKERTPLGIIHLRFVGVFKLEEGLSRSEGYPIFKRIAKEINYNPADEKWSLGKPGSCQ